MSKKSFFRRGIPFFVLVFGGTLGLTQFAQVRYKYRKSPGFTREDAEEDGIKLRKKEELTIDREFEKIEKMDIDNWENIRGPRPWEENSPAVLEMQKRLEMKNQREKQQRN